MCAWEMKTEDCSDRNEKVLVAELVKNYKEVDPTEYRPV